MQLEDQCCSLELAKKLKELGVRRDSLFYWIKSDYFNNEYYISIVNIDHMLDDNKEILINLGHECCESNNKIIESYSAFIASELLELFPMINGMPVELMKICGLINGIYYCCRYFGIDGDILHVEDGKNAANACAKLLIYLIENGIIKNEVS